MATKTKHAARSRRSSHDSKSGMYKMWENGKLKTMRHRKLKEAKGNAATS